MIIWTAEAAGGQSRLSTKMKFLKMSKRDNFLFVYKISSDQAAACAQYSGKNSSLKMQSLEKSGFCSAGCPSVSRSGVTFTFRPQERKTKSHVLYSLPLNRIFRTIKQVTCRCNYRQRETLNGFLAF